MRRFNFLNPLMIIAVAFLTYNVSMLVFGFTNVEEEVAGNFSFMFMLIAAVVTFARIQQKKTKRK